MSNKYNSINEEDVIVKKNGPRKSSLLYKNDEFKFNKRHKSQSNAPWTQYFCSYKNKGYKCRVNIKVVESSPKQFFLSNHQHEHTEKRRRKKKKKKKSPPTSSILQTDPRQNNTPSGFVVPPPEMFEQTPNMNPSPHRNQIRQQFVQNGNQNIPFGSHSVGVIYEIKPYTVSAENPFARVYINFLNQRVTNLTCQQIILLDEEERQCTCEILKQSFTGTENQVVLMIVIPEQSKIRGWVSIRINFLQRSTNRTLPSIFKRNAFFFKSQSHKPVNDGNERSSKKRKFSALQEPNKNEKRVLHSTINAILPGKGTLEGGQINEVFFSISDSSRMNGFLENRNFSRCLVTGCKFGELVGDVDQNSLRKVENYSFIMNWVKKNHAEKYGECAESQFVILISTPPSKYTGLVDVSISTIHETIFKENGYEYVDGKIKETGIDEFLYIKDNDDFSEDLEDDHKTYGLSTTGKYLPDDFLNFDSGNDDFTDDYFDVLGGSPLFYAVAQNRFNVVKDFVEKKKLDFFKKDVLGFSPLDVAHFFQRFEILKYFEQTSYKKIDLYSKGIKMKIEIKPKMENKVEIIEEEKEEKKKNEEEEEYSMRRDVMFVGHSSFVCSVLFFGSPINKIVSCSVDCTIRIWDDFFLFGKKKKTSRSENRCLKVLKKHSDSFCSRRVTQKL